MDNMKHRRLQELDRSDFEIVGSERDRLRKKYRLQHLLHIAQGKVVMHGEIKRRIDQAVVAVPVPLSHFDNLAKIERIGIVGRRLGKNHRSIFILKANSIGMSVLLRTESQKLPGDPGAGIAFLMQLSIDGLLAQELVQPVVGIVLADKKSPPYKMGNRWKTVRRRAVGIHCFLPRLTAVKQDGGVFVHLFFYSTHSVFPKPGRPGASLPSMPG